VHVSTLGATTVVGAISYVRIGWLPSVKGRPVGEGESGAQAAAAGPEGAAGRADGPSL
jgi:hypothetical protein